MSEASSPVALSLSHSGLDRLFHNRGLELMRQMLQGDLDLRGVVEALGLVETNVWSGADAPALGPRSALGVDLRDDLAPPCRVRRAGSTNPQRRVTLCGRSPSRSQARSSSTSAPSPSLRQVAIGAVAENSCALFIFCTSEVQVDLRGCAGTRFLDLLQAQVRAQNGSLQTHSENTSAVLTDRIIVLVRLPMPRIQTR